MAAAPSADGSASSSKDEQKNDGPFTVLITGANRGIGLEFVLQYLQLESPSYNVIACCRKTSDGLNKLAANDSYKNKLTIYENLDVTNEENIQTLANTYKDQSIDIVLLNAGIMPDVDKDHFGSITKSNMMRVFEVNTVGCVLIAQSLLNNILLSSRKQYIVITSGLGTIQDNSSGNYLAYRTSKVAINCAMQDIKFRKECKDIHTILLEPGFVPTDLTPLNKQYATTKTEDVVKGMIGVIDNYKNIPNGAFWSWQGKPFGSEKDENGNEKYPNGKF